MLTALVLFACGEAPAPPPASPAPAPAPAPAAAAPAPAHGAAPASAPGVFQGIVLDAKVGGELQYVKLKGCDGTRWVAGTPLPLSEGQTLVTLGGEERATAIPGVPGEPMVRFVARMAPAVAPLDCSPAAQAGYPQLGTVLQAHTSAGYTYVEIAYCDRVAWVAGPETALVKGKLVGHADGTPQVGFESKSLGRRFDHITFVPAMGAVEGDELTCD